MNELMISLFLRICLCLKGKHVVHILSNYKKYDDKILFEALELFVEKLEHKLRSRTFEFNDQTKRILLKGYVITAKEGEPTLEGFPTIVLNDFKLGLQGDKNPVVDLELVYDTIEKRNEDLEKIKFELN